MEREGLRKKLRGKRKDLKQSATSSGIDGERYGEFECLTQSKNAVNSQKEGSSGGSAAVDLVRKKTADGQL